MIYIKLAARNFSRSVKDYAIYFFTVAISAMIFYTFNALSDQTFMLEFVKKTGLETGSLRFLFASISIFVAFVVAALVLFSNNFIIRRRKREIGIYLLLGMNQHSISRMLFVETLALGIFATVLGIAIGIAFSGVFSLIFSGMLNGVTIFSFNISVFGLLMTAILYALIFLAVAIFSSIAVSRYTLSRLLLSQRQNEVYRPRNNWVSGILGFFSIAALAIGYILAVINIDPQTFNPLSPVYFLIAILVTLGSLGFFYAGIGFMMNLTRRFPNFYFKGLNSFTIGQILRKVNSNTLVLTATSLLLAITITSIGFIGMLRSLFNTMVNQTLPYSYTVLYLTPEDPLDGFMQAAQSNPDNPLTDQLTVNVYPTNLQARDLLSAQDQPNADQWLSSYASPTCEALDLTTYNRLQAKTGKPNAQLANQQIGLQLGSSHPKYSERVLANWKKLGSLPLNGENFELSFAQAGESNDMVYQSPCTFIVPDTVAAGLPKAEGRTILFFSYANESDTTIEQNLEAEIYRVGHGYWDSLPELQANYQITQALFLVAGLYLEFIFLMACAMVLAMQLIIDAVESGHQYRTLRNLGADAGAIDQTIFRQVTFYFFAPVILAVLDAGFALSAFFNLFGTILALNGMIIFGPIVVMVLVYGAYYLLTWKTCSRLIRQSVSA